MTITPPPKDYIELLQDLQVTVLWFLGHANIKMTERYAKLGREHIMKTGNTAKVIWSMLDKKKPSGKGGQDGGA